MMKFIKKCTGIILLFIIFSCDHVVGEKGVVENELTGERIENVEVILSSEPADITDFTDSNGYFNAIKIYPCGPLSRCSPDFILTFKKEGFESVTIDENYPLAPSTEFVTEGTKDTLIIKMIPN